MKITRIAAVSFILASAGANPLFAQTIRSAAEPAEYPPASYQGRQYVDSKGCVFIRAGIDGNVNWVPRVNRARQQLCGAQPTSVAGASKGPAASQLGPEIITLVPEATTPVQTAPATPAPTARPVTTAVKPTRTPASTSTGAATAPRRVVPAAVPEPQPVRPTRAPAPVPAAPRPSVPSNAGGPCPGASALSQQYINKGPDVRCGPQASDPLSSLTPNTRILPLHVYQERRLSSDVEVPTGYRAAWTDGRLNRNRAERTVRPAVIAARADIPQGFTRADRGDDRFNPARGARTPQGDAQMAQIWTDGLPRKPVAKPLDKVPFSLREAQAVVAQSAPYGFSAPRQNSADGGNLVLRLSTRSAEAAAEAAVSAAQPEPQRRRYVRAVTLANPAEAQAIARALETATGLDMRIGEVTRDGQAHQVVLSGPFTAGAEQALERVRAAGFPMARLSK